MATTTGEEILEELAARIVELDELILEKETKRVMDTGGRFNNATNDTEAFVENMRNKNTARETQSDIKIFTDYLMSQNKWRSPESIDSVHINRYLQEKHYDVNILTDIKFKHSRDVLSAKMKNLKTQGKGNRPNAADSLNKEEVSILYEKGALGLELRCFIFTGNPTSLNNTIWWNNTTHFGLRSRQEHIDMKWGDVCLKTSSDGQEYLEYSERSTKTRTGQGVGRPFNPKMFSVTDDLRCPVEVYKTYRSQRPEAMKAPESPFYLAVNTNLSKNENALWFVKQNMGKNKLGSIMKVMCEQCGITGRKVNPSARKTTVTTLVHNGVPPTEVMQITGHRNINSINHYSSASLEQQKRMSNILSDLSVGPNGDTRPYQLQNEFRNF
ncbi:uncharacterized protein LOC110461792 [Mizuhopecten yessoensis]|uniref:uncharacterized protein LOC110461792 n=1 Tax=Mizuhopecten yessoensis TaxID=6573 RepID=UPI000B458870|nr:uncharacterized protein LOC110461792 [Mizuhopecten yessoensis]